MKVTKAQLQAFLLDEAGQDVIEYALLAALIALATLAAMHSSGQKLGRDYTAIGGKL